MLQLSPPRLDDPALEASLPAVLERVRDAYLLDVGQKLIVFLAAAIFLYFAARFARRLVGSEIEDVNRRHNLRKWIGYVYALLLVLFAASLFANSLGSLGTILGLAIAGVAVALQDVLKSMVGWLYLSSRAGIHVGSRIEVNGVVGDVIDIGVLKTTLLEVGNLVYGRQATGRVVTVPNFRLLADTVMVSAAESPFVWQEVRITVTREGDWERAEAILREIGEEMHAEVAPELAKGFAQLERRYAFKYGTLTPIVYVTLGELGIELTLRFLVHVRRRRGSEDRVVRSVLAAFARDPSVKLTYPTYRVFRPDGEPG